MQFPSYRRLALGTLPILTAAFVVSMVIPATSHAAPAVPASPLAQYTPGCPYVTPTHFTPGGVPEYGMFGQGPWQVAGIANLGEPSMRIVYDQSVPGARDRALAVYHQMTGELYYLGQPGVTTGLSQVGYSAHYDGVQFQLWGNNPYIDEQFMAMAAAYCMPLIRP